MNTQIIGGGCKVPKKDIRDFSHKKKFGALTSIPDFDFDNGLPYPIKDQGGSDLCTCFSLAEIAERYNGVEIDPEFTFSKGKFIEGNWKSFGLDPVDALKAAINYGFLSKETNPYKLIEKGRDFVANPDNWGTQFDEPARILRMGSYFKPDGGKDLFDSIRGTLWQIHDIKGSIFVGIYWQDEFTFAPQGIVPIIKLSDKTKPHAFVFYGQKNINGTVYLKAQLSNNSNIGDKGIFYFPREIVNQLLFAYVPRDVDPEETKKETWNLLQKLYDFLNNLLKKYVPTKAIEVLKWDTPTNARHSARVIMDTYNLKWAEKDLLCAVIQQESGFNVKAINHNKNGSTDYGIVQINSTYWIGKGKYFESSDEVFNNPEKSIRFMCDAYKNGHLNWWYGYTQGGYKKYMPK